ncbi:MAG TPA: hypothetical protein VGO61_15845 [Steroidobacteraceae bacterium]|jgi:hypothetical protein|nr:hypothetical protein [Steroidobacteraceae bacterium]
MMTLNLKAVASAFAALALTVMLSWTFVDATSLTNMQRHTGTAFLAAVSTLVR